MFVIWAATIVIISVIIVHETYAFSGNTLYDEHRREFLNFLLTSAAVNPFVANAYGEDGNHERHSTIKSIHDPQLRDYTNPMLPKWRGTSLPGPLSLSDANKQLMASSEPILNMGRWPDPILRQPSSPIPLSTFQKKQQLEQLQLVASALRNTARNEGAVGLAAQQCGIDASLIFIDNVSDNNRRVDRIKDSWLPKSSIGVFGQSKWRSSQREVSGEGTSNDDIFFQQLLPMQNNQPSDQDSGIFLVNPRIIQRSPESEMLVWTEECLVLPPEFRAILLRDAEVTIEYEVLDLEESSEVCGITKQMTLKGELARCCQHEMQHDRGILIVDHVSLDELLSVNGNPFMAEIENADGLHSDRMQYAYSRDVSESSLLPVDENMVALAMEDRLKYHARVHHPVEQNHSWFAHLTQPANAIELEAKTTASDNQRGNPPNVDKNSSGYLSLEERKRIIQERRAMMQQSRSNTRRADVLELSKQRASIYKTDYKGLSPQQCQGFCP